METSPNEPRTCIPSNIIWNVVDDEALLLDIKTGEYFSLDPIATEIWKKLSDGQSRQEIAAALIATYGVEPDIIKADIDELITELTQAGLWQ